MHTDKVKSLPKAKKFFVYLLLLLLVLAALIKPLTIFSLETYLSSLLETSVKIQSFDLLDLDLRASIKENDNIATIKINSLYPLAAELDFRGNMDAFKVYHPLKAEAELTGSVYYKDAFDIKAEVVSMGAKARIEVQEEGDNWAVDANISQLDMQILQKENNLFLHMSGLVDIDVDFNTEKDSIITLASKKVQVYDKVFEDARLEIKDIKDHIQAYAVFKAEGIDYKGIWFNYHEDSDKFDGKIDLQFRGGTNPLVLNLSGEHNSSVLLAQVDAVIVKSRVSIKDIVYDLNTSDAAASIELDLNEVEKHKFLLGLIKMDLQGDFDAKADFSYKDEILEVKGKTQSLGGDLSLSYKDKSIEWKAQKLSLAKIIHILKIKEKLSAEIDTEGSFVKNRLQTGLRSKGLDLDGTKVEDIAIKALGKIEDLQVQLQLQTEYAKIENASLKIQAFKDFTLESNITTPYTSSPISLESNASYTKDLSSLNLYASSDQLNLVIYEANYTDGRLNGSYRAEVEPSLSALKNKTHIEGTFSYDKVFTLLANTKDFGGLVKTELKGKNINLNATELNVQRLLDTLGQPSYASGKLEVKAKGTFDQIDFTLKTKHLHLNKKYTGLDENLSSLIKGRVNSSELLLWPRASNRYLDTNKGEVRFGLADKKVKIRLPLRLKQEKQRLALLMKSQIELEKEIKAELVLEHSKDRLRLQKISYKDKKLQTDISLDIKRLQAYSKISKQELYGPLAITGKLAYIDDKADLFLVSNSLGGRLGLSLKDKDLKLRLKDLSMVKIANFLYGEGSKEKGNLNGKLDYHIEKKMGDLDLSGRDLIIEGIDIDKSLKELNDILGLNIFAMGKTLFNKRGWKSKDVKLSTEVSQLECDVRITPELIISKDIAMATKYSRIALNTELKHDGEIKKLEVAILDRQGCAIVTQELKGDISDPQLVNTQGTAVVILAKSPKQILKTGGKIVDAGAGLLDSAASLVWNKALMQDSKVTLVKDTISVGKNIFSSGKDILVSGKCEVFYKGKVEHPTKLDGTTPEN